MTSLSPADRLAIADLVAAYAECVDRRNYGEMVELFAPGARIAVSQHAKVPSPEIDWHEDIEAWTQSMREGHKRYFVTTHVVGQQRLSRESTGAKGETYCLAHHLFEDDGSWVNRVMGIRYHDKFKQTRGQWRFLERHVVVDWIEFRNTGSRQTNHGWEPA